MSWSFAIINGRLAEIYFERKKGKLFINAHCYVEAKEYKTAQEKAQIKQDTKMARFTYRNKKYVNQITRKQEATVSFPRL